MLQQMNGGTRGHSMQDESGIKMQKREMAEKDENLEGKRRLALEVIERLRQAYPDADCTLDYDDAWKLLVSVRLAAQCTDARVNVVRHRRRRSRRLSVHADWAEAKPGISVGV